VVKIIELNSRQQHILQIVKDDGPITGEHIAERLGLTRATLRPDLAILTMSGFLDARPRVGYFFSGKTGSQLLTDQIKKMKVKDFQSIPVVVEQSASVYDAITTMFLEDVGTLFVVDEHAYLAGVLSRKDLLRASLGNQDLSKIPVNIIMTRMPNITMCSKDDLVIEVASLLIENQIDGLPVVKQNKPEDEYEVIGRITKTNITKALVEIASDEPI
jgi:CBS domain-containing protein